MNAEKVLSEAKTIQEQVKPHLRDAAKAFHNRESELFKRSEAKELIKQELDIDREIAENVISQLASDTVDPIIQVKYGSNLYIGVAEFKEFDGAYGYINFNDIYGKSKRVVCQQCVNEAELDSEVVHATEYDPQGSFSDGATWNELHGGILKHYEQHHNVIPEEIETGATLASGTTIGGNTSYHTGNPHDNTGHNVTFGIMQGGGENIYVQSSTPNGQNTNDIWLDTS